eukprot:TRINITY_DN6675_c0_g1_i4.p1 TRINITY_DN6675_c0_g1~~TRINITY_DN6675_c0_g1_i4.p1  ORF type:complete len:179 (+),score=38.53 TRINITY_DN6675_c0_g1_i4:40-537(+)
MTAVAPGAQASQPSKVPIATKKAMRVRKSMGAKAGLLLSVSKAARMAKTMGMTKRMSPKAAVAVTAAAECVMNDIFGLILATLEKEKKAQIAPRHVKDAIGNDNDLEQMFKDTQFCGAGVVTPPLQNIVKKGGKQPRGVKKPAKKVTKIATKRKSAVPKKKVPAE